MTSCVVSQGHNMWTRKAYTSRAPSRAGHSYIYKERDSGKQPQARTFIRDQIFCNLVSWSDGTLELRRLAVTTSKAERWCSKGYAPRDRVALHRWTDWDFVAVLIPRLGNIEYREHRGTDDEECRFYQVTPRTDPLAGAKCERDRRVVSECSIFVEESLGLECFWIRIEIWVV
jgi:hypothetical protein